MNITEREIQLITLISQGFSSKEIAHLMELRFTTIDMIRGKLFFLFGVRNAPELISQAYQIGILKIKS